MKTPPTFIFRDSIKNLTMRHKLVESYIQHSYYNRLTRFPQYRINRWRYLIG